MINEIGAIFNVRIEGDTDANLFYTDATNDKVGVGTASPAEKLDVVGKIKVSDNIVIGTSGKGIDFSATAGTGTSELLADYEEGTWAAVLSDGTNTVALGNGTYTKIGRSVFLILDAYSKSMAGLNTAANLTITGIPFTPVNSSINAWIPSLNVASTSFAISCATSGIMYPLRTNNSVDFNLTPLSVFGSPGTMTWQFTANYSV